MFKRSEFAQKYICKFERLGEVLPGTAAEVFADAAEAFKGAGDPAEVVEAGSLTIWGRPAREPGTAFPDDAGDPGAPASPFVNADAPSAKAGDPLRAALARLAPLLKSGATPALARDPGWTPFLRAGDPREIVGEAVKRLYANADGHARLAEPPGPPPNVLAAREVLENFTRAGLIAPHIDINELAQQWREIGSMGASEARRIVTLRLRSATYAELVSHIPDGPPRIDPNDPALTGAAPPPPVDPHAEAFALGGIS